MTYPFGIDVSKWQASQDGTRVMDWQRAVDAGIQFAFVRATYGADYVDPQFAYNWSELRRLGIPHGAYHYFRPAQSLAQIDTFVDLVQPEAGERLVLDFEDAGGLDRNALTVKMLRALELVKEKTGRYPLIYSRSSWLDANIIMSMLPEVDWWLAQYRWAYPYPLYTPEYPSELITAPLGIERQQIKFHQSGERGNGGKYGAASHYVDTDRFIGTNEELVSYFGGASETQHNVYLPIVTTPPEPKPDALAVEPYSQNDPRWKNNKLGTSSTTIGWNGCLITCVAMVLNYYNSSVDNPAELNEWLTTHNGYTNGNLFNWNSINWKISMWVDCLNTPAPLSQIDAALARGEPVIVHVDFYPSTNPIDEHYVLLIGKLGADDYTMIDSWDGKTLSFKSRYKDAARYIFRIVSYKRQA